MNDRLLFKIYRTSSNYLLRSLNTFIVLNNTPYFMGLDDCSGNFKLDSYFLNEQLLMQFIHEYNQSYIQSTCNRIHRSYNGDFLMEGLRFDVDGRLISDDTMKIEFSYIPNTSIISSASYLSSDSDLVLDTDGSVIKCDGKTFLYNYHDKKRLNTILSPFAMENFYYDDCGMPIMLRLKRGRVTYNKVKYGSV